MVDWSTETHGMACHIVADMAASLERHCNTITNHWGDLGTTPEINEAIEKVEQAKDLCERIVQLMNEAAIGWNAVETLRSAWVKTLPDTHPDRR